MTYKEQLRDPRWQRVQSEVRLRDNYTCQLCGSKKDFVHVHHLYYKPNTKVWEYDIESLITLCETCHKDAHSSLPKMVSLGLFMVIKDGVCIFDIIKYLRERAGIPQQDKNLF